MTLTVGSLFSGIGGIDLGLEKVGMRVIWQVENDAWCRRVLNKHWPNVPKYGDIRAIEWGGMERPDVLAGGFPCQPVSVAGKRLAQQDERWLWPEFARAIRALRPRYILVENVPGLLYAIRDRTSKLIQPATIDAVLGDLAECGYDAEWTSLSAAAVGAPHIRDRVWIVAYPKTLRTQQSQEFDGKTLERTCLGAGGRTQYGQFTQGIRVDQRIAACSDEIPPDPYGCEQGRRQFAEWKANQRNANFTGHGEEGPLADTERDRLEESGQHGLPPRKRDCANTTTDGGWGAVEPDVCRVSSRLPKGLDRTRRLTKPLGSMPDEEKDWIALRISAGRAWVTEWPGVPRIASGIPHRVDRLRGLGNAVVPQCVEVIGAMIVEHANRALIEAMEVRS